MGQLNGVPALIYTLFWPLKVDGRLMAATKDLSLKILFSFKDCPPAALLTIQKGDFKVDLIESLDNLQYDAAIMGNIIPLLELMVKPLKFFSLWRKKQIQFRNFRRLFVILKILTIREATRP
jgi:hypothetical protein